VARVLHIAKLMPPTLSHMLVYLWCPFVWAGLRFAYCNGYANHFHLHAVCASAFPGWVRSY